MVSLGIVGGLAAAGVPWWGLVIFIVAVMVATVAINDKKECRTCLSCWPRAARCGGRVGAGALRTTGPSAT